MPHRLVDGGHVLDLPFRETVLRLVRRELSVSRPRRKLELRRRQSHLEHLQKTARGLLVRRRQDRVRLERLAHNEGLRALHLERREPLRLGLLLLRVDLFGLDLQVGRLRGAQLGLGRSASLRNVLHRHLRQSQRGVLRERLEHGQHLLGQLRGLGGRVGDGVGGQLRVERHRPQEGDHMRQLGHGERRGVALQAHLARERAEDVRRQDRPSISSSALVDVVDDGAAQRVVARREDQRVAERGVQVAPGAKARARSRRAGRRLHSERRREQGHVYPCRAKLREGDQRRERSPCW